MAIYSRDQIPSRRIIEIVQSTTFTHRDSNGCEIKGLFKGEDGIQEDRELLRGLSLAYGSQPHAGAYLT
jgi:hypothetical protein